MKSLLLLLTFTLALCVPSYAQATSSSTETLNWLAKKINIYAGDFDSGAKSGNRTVCTYKVTGVSTNFVLVRSCEFIYINTPSNLTIKTTDKITFSLTDVDPRFIQVVKGVIREDGTYKAILMLNTIDKKNSITIENKSITTQNNIAQPEVVFTRQEDSMVIWFYNEMIANRVATAFEYAVKESVKATGKNSEPF